MNVEGLLVTDNVFMMLGSTGQRASAGLGHLGRDVIDKSIEAVVPGLRVEAAGNLGKDNSESPANFLTTQRYNVM